LSVTLLGNFLLRPVRAITTGLEALTVGAKDIKVEVSGGDELGTLADKFNQLSRRVRADRAQWESERGNFFNVFRSINDAVMLVDADGSLLFSNNEAQGALGLPAGGLIEGKPIATVLSKARPLLQMIEASLAAGTGAHDVALELSDNGNAPVRFLVSIFPLGQGREAAGLLVMLVTSARFANSKTSSITRAVWQGSAA